MKNSAQTTITISWQRFWLIVAFYLLVVSGLSAGLYSILPIASMWVKLGVSLILGFPAAIMLIVLYLFIVGRTGPRFNGPKLVAAGDLEGAKKVFLEQFDYFERRPALEKWRTLLYLDTNRYSPRETILLWLASIARESGQVDEALQYYQQMLTINPRNILAANAINLIRVTRGEPPIPVIGAAPTRIVVSGGSGGCARPLLGLLIIVMLFGFLGLFLGALGWLQYQSLRGVLLGLRFAAVLCVFTFTLGFGYRIILTALLLGDLRRGKKHLKAGRYPEALTAFQNQLEWFRKHPDVDRNRRYVFFSGVYSFKERLLILIAYTYMVMGNKDKMVEAYNQVLEINPNNEYAKGVLNSMESISGAAPAA